jgi:hypothetical protein
MDANIQRALNDKLYDKRKIGALEYVPLLIPPLRNASNIYVDGLEDLLRDRG